MYKMTNKKENKTSHSLFHGSIDPIAIFDMDDHVIDVDPAFVKLFGYFKNELLGKFLPGHIGYDKGVFSEWID
jgi:PAS domain S-box-containing protein